MGVNAMNRTFIEDRGLSRDEATKNFEEQKKWDAKVDKILNVTLFVALLLMAAGLARVVIIAMGVM